MTKWKIEFGAPTTKQAAEVICNFQVLLYLGGHPIANVSGFQVRAKKDGSGHFISPPSTKRRDGKWFNFAGFDAKTRGDIINKALTHAEAGTLLPRYSQTFDRRR